MQTPLSDNPTLLGALCAIGAVFCFSINDMAIKFLSDSYALHEVVLIRALIGMAVLLALILPWSGGLAALRTRRLGMHLARGACVVFANMTFFIGLASLPLADGVAIFFVSPLIITVFSVIFLGETVGPRRWAALALGFLGVLIVLRPGTSVFQAAALLPVLAAFGYATLHMLTRYIGRTENALSMSFYIQLTFIGFSSLAGLAIGDGRFAGTGNASLDFFLREWSMPSGRDWLVLLVVGIASAFGGFFISQAYRVAEAAVVAPFEYAAMPLAVIWGVIVFGDWPDGVALLGIALIIASGLTLVWREARARRETVPQTPRYRR
ncbi:DMT family transporter [Albidovulum sediminicola]|uniref:DMT family transporter n=1 Tax=Albidovulum sediminicola TaxID=2984331 RepID=A0ABT2YYW3_9RHOB|nr:DMT family transporter [Defluviimonas sp. WL0075]MCV2864069.1 DMT family transporter [Defluviimonas sp. WL0075]